MGMTKRLVKKVKLATKKSPERKAGKAMTVKVDDHEFVISDKECNHCGHNYFCMDDYECLSCGVKRGQKVKPYKGW